MNYLIILIFRLVIILLTEKKIDHIEKTLKSVSRLQKR